MTTVSIFHDIRSVENVGAMFRTADAANIVVVYTTGITATPLDRFKRLRKDFAKAALGAELSVSWQQSSSIIDLILRLREERFQIIAIEQSEGSRDYKAITPEGKICFIVGNEVDGLPDDVLNLCDVVAEIPMRGKKESLNVATAFGIAVFRILNI